MHQVARKDNGMGSLVTVVDMSGHSGRCPDTLISAQPTAVFREPQVGAIFASDQTTFRSL
jgi:hypothetical protein